MGVTSYMPRSQIARFAMTVVAFLFLGLIVFLTVFYYGPVYSFATWAPEQPIPFSHKLHAGDKQINCQYCHAYARRSEMAGLPPVSKCMGCHMNITSDAPALAEVERYFDEGKPIEWIKVYDLPDHVWFNHRRHIAKDIECQKCHGPIQEMDVVQRKVMFRMGFCLDCHQEKEAPTDCWTCHT